MARGSCFVVMSLALLSTTADAASGVHVTVTPAAGGRSTTFVASYVAPATTGVVGSIRLRDEVRAVMPSTSAGCQSSQVRLVPEVRRGLHVRVALRPGAGWCAGAYKGKLVEQQSMVCPPGYLCAQYIRVRTLGTFSFVVG